MAKVVVDIAFQRAYFFGYFAQSLFVLFKQCEIVAAICVCDCKQNAGSSQPTKSHKQWLKLCRTKLLIRRMGHWPGQRREAWWMRPFNTCATFVIEYDKSNRKVTPRRVRSEVVEPRYLPRLFGLVFEPN